MPPDAHSEVQERRRKAIVNVASSLITAALPALLVALAGAPTWGWIATGLIIYYVTIRRAS